MFLTSKRIVAATCLTLAFACANADDTLNPNIEYDNVTNPKKAKHYAFNNYAVDGETAFMTVHKLVALQMAGELKGKPYKYISISSEKLGTPDKENCVVVPFEKETLAITNKSWFYKTITASGIDTTLLDEIEKRNCLAIPKSKLGDAIRLALP